MRSASAATAREASRQHAHIFLHIQKTAGTSIRHALQSALPADEIALIYPTLEGIPLHHFAALPEDVRRRYHVVIGHCYWGVHAYLPRLSKYITFLRNPLDRLRSNYWQTRSFYPAHGAPLSDIVTRGVLEEFDNYQLRVIAALHAKTLPCGFMTDPVVDIALKNIRESFEFIGLMEHLDRDWPRLLHVLGLDPMPLPVTNVTAQDDPKNDADYARIDWDRVAYNNRFDTALYEAVKKLDWPV